MTRLRPHRALGALLALSMVSAATACTCEPIPAPAESFDRAALVFEGRLMADEAQGLQRRVGFQVTTVWKGAVSRHLDLRTPRMPMSCGLEGVEVGRTYIVYSIEIDGADWIFLCNRMVVADESERQALAALAPPRPPASPSSRQPCPRPAPGDPGAMLASGQAAGRALDLWLAGPSAPWTGGQRRDLAGGVSLDGEVTCLADGVVTLWPSQVPIGGIGEVAAGPTAGAAPGTLSAVVHAEDAGDGTRDLSLRGRYVVPSTGQLLEFQLPLVRFFDLAP